MTEFRVVVFVPTLRSRGRRFHRDADGMLLVSADELNEDLASHRLWPNRAMVVTPDVSLGVDEPQGETRVHGFRHELVHLVRLSLTVMADEPPAPQAWHPWALKSCEAVAA